MAARTWKPPHRPGTHRWSKGRFSGGTSVSANIGIGGTSADGTPRRPFGWLALFVVLSIVITTLWFHEAPTGPLHAVRVAVHTISTPLGAGGKWVTSPMRRFIFWVSDLGVSRSELQALREQNEDLRARVVGLEEMRLENERLRGLLGEAPATGGSTGSGTEPAAPLALAAAVIGLPVNSYDQVIVLNKGTSDGVELSQPIITARGLLGQIIEVGPNYSKARLITDQKSGVAALVQSNRQPGIVQGSLTGELTLDFVPTDAEVEPGDVVLTSGLGGIYPKGLVIGEVISASQEVNTLYKTIKVRSMNLTSMLEEVLILFDTPPDTRNLPDPELVAPGVDDN